MSGLHWTQVVAMATIVSVPFLIVIGLIWANDGWQGVKLFLEILFWSVLLAASLLVLFAAAAGAFAP